MRIVSPLTNTSTNLPSREKEAKKELAPHETVSLPSKSNPRIEVSLKPPFDIKTTSFADIVEANQNQNEKKDPRLVLNYERNTIT